LATQTHAGRSRRSRRSRAPKAPPLSQRTQIVWGALVGTMTVAGGLLWLLDSGPAPRLDGLALRPLVAAAGPSSIEAIFQTRAPLDRSRWKSIVIHASGSPVGSPGTISAEHKAMRLSGLGYQFVIGNGRGMDDGELHVGYRWLDQLPGAHAAGPRADWYNEHSIGICLVGNGERQGFTDAQVRRLVQVTAALARQLGIPKDSIVLHSDLARTDDPGRFFPAAAFREGLAAALGG
jgi:hypothetical protein